MNGGRTVCGGVEARCSNQLALMERKKDQGSPEAVRGWRGVGRGLTANFADYRLQLTCLRTIEFSVMTCELLLNDFERRPKGQRLVGWSLSFSSIPIPSVV